MTTEDQRAALDAEGIAAIAAAGIPRASITATLSPLLISSVLTAQVRGDTVRLYASGRHECPVWLADARRGDGEPHCQHRDCTAAAALKPVLRRIPKEAK
jgi:hypothetical protein